MALKKKIMMDNGIELEYHRIAMLNIEVNQQMTILVRSYPSESARDKEKDYESGKLTDTNALPYNVGTYLHFPYDKTMNIEKAYDFLKTQDRFKDAEDV